MKTRWIVLSAAVCLTGCGFTEDVGAARLGVYGGTPSTHDSVGLLFNGRSGCNSAGVFLSPRHFLVGSCVDSVDSSELTVGVPDGNRTPMITTTAITTHPGPATGIRVGSEEATVHILVTAAEMPVTRPAPLATAVPAVDDTLTVTGFGTGSGSDIRGAREGPVRVTRVSAGGGDFSFVGVGEVRPCFTDAPVFDAMGNLTGLAVVWVNPDPESCFEGSITVSMSPLASWAAEILAMPVPDPVPAPWDDAGTDDGGIPDAGPSDASSDADPGADASVDVTPSGGGCGCAAPGDGRGEAGWLFAVLGLFAWRLRRRA